MMVAIIAGAKLGLELRPTHFGQQGVIGEAAEGRNGQRAYVNVANGNLVLQNQDELLVGRGLDARALRTYNSQGGFDYDNGDRWTMGVERFYIGGTLYAPGSFVSVLSPDGAVADYVLDGNRYVSKDGTGAYDTVVFDAAAQRYVWRDGDTGAIKRFNTDGVLLSSEDGTGFGISYGYKPPIGLIESFTTNNGDVTVYDYGVSGNNLKEVRTTAGGVTTSRVSYTYDDRNRLASVTVDLSPDDRSVADGNIYRTSYAYDGDSNRVATVTQTDGSSVAFTYRDAGGGVFLVASVTDGPLQTTTFSYDLATRATVVTDALGQNTRYDYDAAGQILKITAPSVNGIAASSQFTYSLDGEPASMVDGEGRRVEYQYVGGNQVLERDAAGNTVSRTFNASNQVLTETRFVLPDPDGAGAAQPGTPLTTRYVYKASNPLLLRFELSPEGRVTEHRYNGFNQRIATLSYAGALASIAPGVVPSEVDLAAWAATQNAAVNQRSDFAYDARGQLQARTSYAQVNAAGDGIVDGSESVERYVYDRAGLLLQTASAAAGATSFSYDGLGRVLASTDAVGRTTITRYADSTAKTVVTLAAGLVTTSSYDATGRLVSQLQSSSNAANLGETRYQYDKLGRLCFTEGPSGQRNWILYDAAGRKVADIDRDGTFTGYEYDKSDRLVCTTSYRSAAPIANYTTSTGALLPGVTLATLVPGSPVNERSWRAYDAAGRLVRTAQTVGIAGASPVGAVQAAVTAMTYDGASRLVKVQQYAIVVTASATRAMPPDPPSSVQDRVTRHFYGDDGKLLGTLDAEGFITIRSYDAAGREVLRTAYATPNAIALRATGTLAQLTPLGATADIRELFLYDGKGQRIGQVDGEGYLTETVYSSSANVVQTFRYANKALGAVTVSSTLATLRPGRDRNDRTTTSNYDKLDRLVQETDGDGVVTKYAYDLGGNLVSTVRAGGTLEARSQLARFDLLGRVTAELSPDGAALLTGSQAAAEVESIWSQYAITHTYDAAGRRTSSRDAAGNLTRFYYDWEGRLTAKVNAAMEVEEYRYSALGRLVSTIKRANRMTTPGVMPAPDLADAVASLTQTLDGRVATATDEEGTVTTSRYNAFGEELFNTRTVSGVQVTESYALDGRGLRTATTVSSTEQTVLTSAAYDAFGRIIRMGDGNGNVRQQAYDRLGRLVTTTDAAGVTQRTTYDAFARQLSQTDALGNVTSFSYDPVVHSMTMVTPEGVSTTTAYNRHGQVQSVSNSSGSVTSYGYDRSGRLVSTSTPLAVESSVFDAAGRLKQTVDGNSNTIAYTYDAAGRVSTRTVDPGGLNLTTSYSYDLKLHQVRTTEPGGVATTVTYDRKGRVVRQALDPGGLNLQTVFSYDSNSKVLSVTDPVGVLTRYTYDTLGRRTSEQVDPAGRNLLRSWTYDKAGNATSSTDAGGNVTRYAYDAGDRLVFTLDPAGGLEQRAYDAQGRLVKTTAYARRISMTGLGTAVSVLLVQPRVLADPAHDQTVQRVYDRNGRTVATVDGTGALVRYAYDGNGNVLERVAYANPLAAGTVPTHAGLAAAVAAIADPARDAAVRNTFDAANRLTLSVDGTGAVTRRSYDGVGNVVQETAYATALAAGAAVSSVTAGPADRVTSRAYDAANREVFTIDALNGVREQTYDGAGRVVARTAYQATLDLLPTLGLRTTVADIRRGLRPVAYLDRTERYGYDTAGRQALAIDADGGVTETSYDRAGRIGSVVQRATRVAASSLPAALPLLQMRALVTADAAADRITRKVYDAAGRLVYQVDPLFQVTGTEYDALGRVVRSAHYLASVNPSVVLTPAGVVAALAVDPSARAETYQYDAAGYRTAVVDALGQSETYEYDALGNVLAYVNRNRSRWDYSYDAAGNRTDEISPQVQVTASRFEAGSVVAGAALAARITTRTVYDALGRVTQRIEASGVDGAQRVTRYDYDAAGRQVRVLFPPVGVYDPRKDDLTRDSGLHPRADGETTLETLTFYDALGNAVAGRDVGGAVTQKVYDRVGRLLYEVDARGYVTGTTYDVFGGAISLTRYAARTGLAERSLGAAGQAVTRAEVEAALSNPSVDHSADRTVLTSYDRLGRVADVTQPKAVIHGVGLAPASQGTLAAARTVYEYNAFGDRVEEATASNAAGLAWALTSHYFDRAGRETETVDALGYLTRKGYDAVGNLVSSTEYASRLASWKRSTFDAPVEGDPDTRTVKYGYDALNRKTSEMRLAVEYSSGADGTSQRGDLTTVYEYDAVGNQTKVRDALGNTTATTYDALGRVLAVQSPVAASGEAPLTEYQRDVHGNVVVQVEYAHGAARTADPGLPDRRTFTHFDVLGRAIEVMDASGSVAFSSFDAYGRVAKTWRAVTDGTAKRTQFQVNTYDRVGQLVGTRTPASTTVVRGGVNATYVPGAKAPDGSLAAPNTMTLGWSSLVDPAAGTVRVQIDYLSTSSLVLDEYGGRVAGEASSALTVTRDLTPSAAVGGAQLTWMTATDFVVYIRVLQQVGGQWTTRWEGSPAAATGAGMTTVTQAQAGLAVTSQEFNAFGEMTTRGTQGGRQEYFEYDNAGRLWRTNSGDGVDRIQLFDVQGNVTAELRSSGSGGGNLQIRDFAGAAAAAVNMDIRRVDFVRDALGRVTQRWDSTRVEQMGGVLLHRQSVSASVRSAVPVGDLQTVSSWNGQNEVTLNWSSLAPLGSGDIRVSIDYTTPVVTHEGDFSQGIAWPGWQSGGLPGTRSSAPLDGTANASGAVLTWSETSTTPDGGGVGAVVRVRVEKKDVTGVWRTVIDQAPGADSQIIEVAAPADPMAALSLQMRSVGASAWGAPPGAGLVNFGNAYRYDAAALGDGSFEYLAQVTTPQGAVTVGTGVVTVSQPPLLTITWPITYSPAEPGVLTWTRQNPATGQVFKYRPAGGSTWNSLAVAQHAGTTDGVDTSLLAAGTYEFELLWTWPGATTPYAHGFGTFSVIAKVPGVYVPAVGMPSLGAMWLTEIQLPGTPATTEAGNNGTPGPSVLAMAWSACNATMAKYRTPGGAWYDLPPINNDLQSLTQAGYSGFQRVRLDGLAPGTYEIEVTAPLGAPMHATATLVWSPTAAPVLTMTTAPYTAAYVTPETPQSYGVWVNPATGLGALSTNTRSFAQATGVSGAGQWSRPTVYQVFDRWGNVLSVSDPRSAGWVTTYRYNANSQAILQTKPAASADGAAVTRMFYDALGRQLAARDALGRVNGSVFDAVGNLVTELHADGGVVRHRYDGFGQKVITTDALGHDIRFTYDALGRLLSTDKGKAEVFQTAVEGWIGWTGTQQLMDKWTYDELGRRISYTNGAGQVTRYGYDLRDNLVRTTQPLGQMTQAAYDAQGRKIGEVDANSYAASWSYDYFGQLRAHTDLGGNVYSYTYDAVRQLVRQTSNRKQDLRYAYDGAGQLTSVTDAALGKVSSYAYDAGGRRVRETVLQGGSTYQDNHLGYDALGNLRDVADARVHMNLDYDLVGNRTRIASSVGYQGVKGDVRSEMNRYFAYDATNRQVLVDALDWAGTLSPTQGHRITYDLNGNRKSDIAVRDQIFQSAHLQVITGYADVTRLASYSDAAASLTRTRGLSVETYQYDDLNRLTAVERDGFQVDARFYDGADREVSSGVTNLPASYRALLNQGLAPGQSDGQDTRVNRYDANGRLLHQTVVRSDGVRRSEVSWDPNERPMLDNLSFRAAGYDNVGNAVGYTVWDRQSNSLTNYTTTLDRFEGYQAREIAGRSTVVSSASTTQKYDENGLLVGVVDSGQHANDRSFVNDASGKALFVQQQGNVQRQLIVNGEVLGIYGAGVDAQRPTVGGGNPNYANIDDFEFGYAPIRSGYPAPSPGAYQVRAGDTLESVAQSAYGDSALWFRIAEANGLTRTSDLKVGQTLNIPNRVATISNNSGSYKPYDPSRITGDLNPTLPMPSQDGGCGGVGQLLMLVVAVAVTAVTGGVGGAVLGSIASQAVGLATGTIDRFSWKAVALAAISAGVSKYLPLKEIDGLSKAGNAAMKAVQVNAISQGIGVATGLQQKFDWRGVAAAGVGAGVGERVGESLGVRGLKQPAMSVADRIMRSAVTAFAAGAGVALARGGRVSVVQVATDAFGNVLGESLAGAMSSPSVSGDESWAADLADRKRSLDPLGLKTYASDAAGVMRSAQTLWGAPPAETTSRILSDTSTNAEILEGQMRGDHPDGDLVPTGGGNVRISSGAGGRTMVNGVSVNERADRALQSAGDLAGMGEVYRDYRLLGGLMSELQQETTLNRLRGAVQEKLGMMRVLPSPEALGAVPGIGSDGSVRYNNADLIDRYGDALRKVEMWKQGIIELDTRSMLITSIGTAKLSPAGWVADNTRRYANAFVVGVDEGQRRYDAGALRYPLDMPGQLQVGLFADGVARDAVISYNRSIGVPEGPGQLLSMNRWSYDPSGSGAYNRIDLLMDLGPSRNSGATVLRTAIEGKASLAAVQSSAGQLQRVYEWVTPTIRTVTPQGVLPWTPQPKRLR
jgi:YD repeat-containing protein